jgi:hypothetical protein
VSSNRCGREDTVERINEPMLHGGVLERPRSGGAEIPRLLTIRVAAISRIGEKGTFLETDFWRFGLIQSGNVEKTEGKKQEKSTLNSCL